ncbi:MAG: putative DNA binding domain-containing protein [Candidatus Cloacimonetes bacterium]|nr:putative DNA binding domain-containing protein [Candidatus Cloacimonadota bacterium]
MRNKKELALILQEGEGYFTEFKEGLSGVDKDFVAFANSSGGKVLIGVTDDGKVKGITITNRIKSEIQNIARNCDPGVKLFVKSFENILIVEVREGEDKPYKCSSGFYKRIGATSQKMTRNEILSFFKTEGKVRFDELINIEFKYPKDFNRDRLNMFLELAGISKTLSIDKILTSLGVVDHQNGNLYFNNAGVLLFAKEPQSFISWSVFTVVLFKDKEGVDVIDRKEITGSLFEIIEQVMDFVKLYTKVAYRITGKPQRENIYEYPFEAIREAVINSVMHKNYFERGHNNILKFFPNRIQIENIWVKPQNFILGKTVFRRNHLIADLFSRINFGEKLGSGMKRMRDVCKKENSPYPEIEYTDTHFYIVFKQSKEYLKLESTTPKTRVKIRVKTGVNIIALIKENPLITIPELAEKIGLTVKGVEWNIKKLKEKGKLKRIGPAKGGYWKIVE